MENNKDFSVSIDFLKSLFPYKNIFLLKIDFPKNDQITLTIGKKGGIKIEDCEMISKYLLNYISSENYGITVQSPGIGWHIDLKKPELFPLFIGEKVKVIFKTQNKQLIEEGILLSLDNKKCVLSMDKKTKEILFDEIIHIKTTL